MGYRIAIVLSATSFCLGVLFTSFNVDYRLLYQPVTTESAQSAIQFYTTFYKAPVAVKTLLHTVMGINIISLVTKLNKWDESAVFFDGTSLAAFMGGVVLYLSVIVPGVKAIAEPAVGETEAQRIESLRVIAAGNTMVIGCLVGVLAMQAGQEYARRYEAREAAKVVAAEKKEL